MEFYCSLHKCLMLKSLFYDYNSELGRKQSRDEEEKQRKNNKLEIELGKGRKEK